MLSPKRTLHRKQMKGRMKGIASRGNSIAFGEFGIQALEKCWLTARQIEAARIAMTRKIKRGGRVWIRVFPTSRLPVTLQKLVWVRVRALSNSGQPSSSRVASFSKWVVSNVNWPWKLSMSQHRSSPSSAKSSKNRRSNEST